MSLVAKIFQKIKLPKALNKYFHLNELSIKRLSENNRFYPGHIAKHKDEPVKDKFQIAHHPVYGEGVVSKVFFSSGQLLFRFDGSLRHDQTLYTLQIEPGLYIEDLYFMGKVLHSCEPNTFIDMKSQECWCSRPIQPGDFVTIDYEATEDELFRSFQCQCGSNNCRGQIVGRNKITITALAVPLTDSKVT
jgi:hypothetical protein